MLHDGVNKSMIVSFFKEKDKSLCTVKGLKQNSLHRQDINPLTFSNSHWLLLPIMVTPSFSMLPVNLSQHEHNLCFQLKLSWHKRQEEAIYSQARPLLHRVLPQSEENTLRKKGCVWAVTFRCTPDSSQMLSGFSNLGISLHDMAISKCSWGTFVW